MLYLDQELRVVVVYPEKVALSVNRHRVGRGLPEIQVKELEFGLDEVQRVVNPLKAELLTSTDATIHGLLDILSGHVDILWIITHGMEGGFFLNDGLVNASELTSLLRSAGTFLCVLNTCESYEVAHKIASELDVAILCTVSPVPDRSAFISGTLFARHLASGLDYVTAWEKAKPGQDHPYQLFQARRVMNPRPIPRPKGQPQSLEETVYMLENSLAEFNRTIYGVPELNVPPLRQMANDLTIQFKEMKESLRHMSDKLDKIEQVQSERSKLMVYIIIGLLVIGAAVGYLVVKGG